MIQHFLDYIAVERKYSEQTVDAYRRDLEDFCRSVGVVPAGFDPRMAREDDVREWVLVMLEEQHLSPRSVKRKMSALRSFYKYLLREKVVECDITRKVMLPKVKPPLPVFFKPHEMAQATAQMEWADDFESIRNSLIIDLFYQTGMRLAEMTGLADSDVDTSAGQIRIFGKRRKERIVPIGDALIAHIRCYLAARQALEEETGSSLPSAFLVRRTGKGELVPLSRDRIYNIVRARMGEVSTLKKHSPHVLRHTFATTLLDKGADIRSIQALLGHASLHTTQVYTHTTFEQIQRVYSGTHPRAAVKEGQKGGKNSPK